MSVEILIAFRQNAWATIEKDFKNQRKNQKSLTIIPKLLIKFLREGRAAKYEIIQQLYKTPIISKFKYHLISTIKDESELDKLTLLNTKYGSKIIIIGAFSYNTGLQYGLTYVTNVDGTTTIQGTIMYPLSKLANRFMPDNVIYDENGIETSRTAAAEFKNVHRMSGQTDKIF